MPKYSIVIPCYNEIENIDNLISHIIASIDKFDSEFILVENGSKDNSRLYFQEHVEGKNPKIRVVYVDRNFGYGYGIQQGLKVASGEYLGWTHADMQIPIESFFSFFEIIEKQDKSNELFLKSRRKNRTAFELIFTKGQALFSTCLFKHKMVDVASVPSLFSRSLIEKKGIEAMPNDFSIDIYIYWEAVRQGYRVIRPMVSVLPRKNGGSTWNRGMKSRIRQSCVIIKDSIKIKRGVKIV